MIEIPHTADYAANAAEAMTRSGGAPCVVCGRFVARAKQVYRVRVVEGGTHLAAPDEPVDPAGDMGHWPLGSDCKWRHPELHSYAKRIGSLVR